MRVGLVIYGNLTTLSGGYLYDRKLVDFLRRHGDTVEVISIPWRDYLRHVLDNFDRSLYRRLLNIDVDVLLQDELNHPSLFGINQRLRNQVNYPIVSIVHHLRCAEQHPAWLLNIYRRVEEAYLTSVDGFVFNSQTTRQMVEQVCACKKVGVVATPGGDALAVDAPRWAARSQNNSVHILFVGNWIERKGLHQVITALGGLGEYNWRLTIAGQTGVNEQYTHRVLGLIEEYNLGARVQILGAVTDEALLDVWLSGDILVVPSQYEGFGIVYLEAMRFGVVPVGGLLGAAGEIIQHGVNGWLVHPENVEDLRLGLETLIRYPDYRQQLSKAALARYDQFPTWEESMRTIRHFLLQQSGTATP